MGLQVHRNNTTLFPEIILPLTLLYTLSILPLACNENNFPLRLIAIALSVIALFIYAPSSKKLYPALPGAQNGANASLIEESWRLIMKHQFIVLVLSLVDQLLNLPVKGLLIVVIFASIIAKELFNHITNCYAQYRKHML